MIVEYYKNKYDGDHITLVFNRKIFSIMTEDQRQSWREDEFRKHGLKIEEYEKVFTELEPDI